MHWNYSFVFFVIDFSINFSLIFKSSFISTNTGTAPHEDIALDVIISLMEL